VSVVVALLGAAGVVLFVGGLPLRRRPRLSTRVEPYLSGLRGRASALMMPTGSARERGIGARLSVVTRVFPALSPDLASRLAAEGEDRTGDQFRLEQVGAGLLLTVVMWVLLTSSAVLGTSIDPRLVPLLSVLTFTSGFLGRDWLLSRRIQQRRQLLEQELPTAIDLVTLAIMSGESVPSAFARVALLLGSGIGAELSATVADMRAGATAISALEGLKERVPIGGMERFVDALCTAIERGAPLADVLRAQAEDGRETRRRNLMEMGGKREVLMLVPVVFLIMPVVVIFALYPGLVSLDLLVP
jgi:tight adherence protein C